MRIAKSRRKRPSMDMAGSADRSSPLSLGQTARVAFNVDQFKAKLLAARAASRAETAGSNLITSRGAGGVGGIARGESTIAADPSKRMIGLFSTACAFADYMNKCPSDLWDLNIFNTMYEKWPTTRLMQDVAAKMIIVKRPATRQISRLRKRSGSWGSKSISGGSVTEGAEEEESEAREGRVAPIWTMAVEEEEEECATA